MKIITILGLSIPYFFIVTILLNLGWYMFVFGKMYYCSDPLIFPLMFPPFVHERVMSDYYIAPKILVDSLGTFFLLTNLVLPITLAAITARKAKI